MKSAHDKTAPRSSETESDSLGPVWAIFGCGLFVIALSVPIATVQYFPAQEATVAGITGKAAVKATEQIVDAGKPEDIPGNPAEATDPLRALLSVSEIEPGRGIGDIRIGDPLHLTLNSLPEPSYTSFETDGKTPERVYGYTLGPTDFEIRATGEIQHITSISLTVRDCHALLYYQPRQEGIPGTVDGLSIGSHQSRVIAQYGEPLLGKPRAPIPGPMVQPTKQLYPGMSLRYCPDYNLLRQITVLPFPQNEEPADEPLVAALQDLPPAVMPQPNGIATTSLATSDTAPLVASVEPRGETAAIPDASELPQGLSTPQALADVTRPAAPVRSSGQVAGTRPAASALAQDGSVDTDHRLAIAPNDVAPGGAGQSAGGTNTAATLGTPDETIGEAPEAVAQGAPPPTRAGETGLPGAASPAPDAIDELKLATGAVQLSSGTPVVDRRSGPSLNAFSGPIASGGVQILRTAEAGEPLTESEQQASDAEEALALSLRQRRNLQIRMRLMGHNPSGIDGVFGPNTRDAIAELQQASDLPATGYIDTETRSLILDKTRVSYRDWVRSLPKPPRQRPTAVIASRIPMPRNAPECKRDEDGTIVANQSWSCDVSVLEEGLRGLGSLFDLSGQFSVKGQDVASKDISG